MAKITGASLAPIYDRLRSVPAYHPLDTEAFADWTLEAGDIVTVERDGQEYTSPVHSMSFTWKGGAPTASLHAGGEEKREPVARVSRRKYSRGGGGISNMQHLHYEMFSEDGYLRSQLDMTAAYLRTEFEDAANSLRGELEMTASHLRTEFEDANNNLRGELEVTASHLRTEFEDADANLRGEFEVTASKLRADFEDANNSLRGELETTASHLRTEFEDAANSLRGELEVTASHLRTEFEDADANLRGEFEVTASKLRTDFEDANNNLRGELETTASHLRTEFEDADANLRGEFEVTASKLRTDFEDANNNLRGELEVTASHLRTEFEDAANSLRGELEMTASHLRTEFEDADANLRGEFEVTASHLRTEFEDADANLRGEFEVTASHLRTEFEDANNSLRGDLEVSASRLRAAFEDADANIRAALNVQANRIGLVVEGTGSNAHIKPAEIVAAINGQTGESQARISADKVLIDGNTMLSGNLGIRDGMLWVKGNAVFGAATGPFVTINNGKVNATTLQGTTVSIPEGGESDNYANLTYADVANMIVRAAVEDNQLKLWKRTDPASSPSITFKKAASSLSGAWSGSTLTVTPTGESTPRFTVGFTGDPNELLGVKYKSVEAGSAAGTVTVSGAVTTDYYDDDAGIWVHGTERHAFNMNVNLSGLLESRATTINTVGKSVSTGTYTPTAGKIGISSFEVTVNPEPSWNAGYDTAEGYFDPPATKTASNVSDSFTVGYPKSDRSGQGTYTYTMTKGTPGTSGYASVVLGSSLIARIDISNWYTEGVAYGKAHATHSPTATIDTTAKSSEPDSSGYDLIGTISPGSSTTWYTMQAKCDTSTKNYKLKVTPATETKSITSNGTYTPSSGKVGFSSVTVNVTATHSPTASGFTEVASDPGNAFEEKSISPGYGTSWYTYNASCGGTTKNYKLKVNGPADKVTTIYPTTDQSLNAGGSVNVYARSNGTDIASVNVSAKSVVTSASDFTKQSSDPGSSFTQKSISPGYGTNWYTFQTTGTNGGGTTNYKLKVDAPADKVTTIYPSTNQTLGYGGSVTVYARSNGSNVANINVSAPADRDVTIFPAGNVNLGYGASVTVYARKDGANAANIVVSAPADRYNAGYDAGGATAHIRYVSSKNSHQGTLTPGGYIETYYTKSDGSQPGLHTWWVPEPWFYYRSDKGSNFQGVLDRGAGPYIGIKLHDGPSQPQSSFFRDATWEIPESGSTSHSPTIDNVWTSSSWVSGATEYSKLATQYKKAKNDGDNLLFRVKCGTSTKTYIVDANDL